MLNGSSYFFAIFALSKHTTSSQIQTGMTDSPFKDLNIQESVNEGERREFYMY
jgi:hypothetical protein